MSAWDDVPQVQEDLTGALDTFDWTEVAEICRRLVERMADTAEAFPLGAAKSILNGLRRKRRFGDMKRLAESLMQSGQDDALVLRQYAQALIDDGALIAAKGALDRLAADAAAPEGERFEAVGLLGRLHKQLYVDARRPGDARQQENLRTGLRFYRDGYHAKPKANLWHAINVVALAARARRDGVALGTDLETDEVALARTVLEGVAHADDPWSAAIRMEANVALGDWPRAAAAAAEYVADPKLDAFEFASTLRQLEQVWQLAGDRGPGAPLIGGLRAAVVSRLGGEIAVSASDVGAARQANFDDERLVALPWWKLGLTRCVSVARIETEGGRKVGSGFLVDPSDFFADTATVRGPVLLTNWHVISEGGREPDSIAPAEAFARFEASDARVRVRSILAASSTLDACFVVLDPLDPELGCCPMKAPPIEFDVKKRQRVYVIGYPKGGDLSFSIHDSVWLDMNETYLHYRTPTHPGSSGSPVFDQDGWKVVGLHQAGGRRVPRLRTTGTYEANVGIAITAIREAVSTTRIA
jgi:hypothetical protein